MHLKAINVFIILVSLTSGQLKKVELRQGDNPGKCDKSNRGKLTLINDRENNDKLLICAKQNDDYVWKTTDGSNPTGEFFNPAYDCSDILNKIPEAKDGFYWIKLSGSVPKKVWCDMTTDGGGYMLIGRTNTSSVWKLPSYQDTVEPFGKPHWSSSLGDAPIVDFRVQVATDEDFNKTRSHWSFRLQNKRPLKNLLVVNKGGCGRLSPGIGDIAYVRDLETEKIVTTTFRCSHFGKYHPESSRFGWDMMNFCLERPCLRGFAYIHNSSTQTDYSGAFSYSASEQNSGISHNSTSFVGCDNGKCCACFGHPRGKKNYCGTECRANYGGTTLKNVYTWFWVRSSLPKNLWNKCMEFKVQISPGKVVWYRLYNQNPVPVMGRCSQNEALLNDGIVVVPDNVTAQKVPPVPGLLKYRKDTKKLYVRSNETWNVIGEEKKVLKKAAEQVKPKLDQLERKIDTVFTQLKKSLDELKASKNSQFQSVNKIANVTTEKGFGKSCASLYKNGARQDGIYGINPDGLGYFQVRCDMQTDRGGWTVFQRRQDGSVDFWRGWKDYKNGFGDLNGEFWLGLDKINRLTKSGQNILKVDLMDFDYTKIHAMYGVFSVDSESESYKLNIGSYSGNGGDSLKIHNGMKFSTRDRDNDRWTGNNCAVVSKGAWWYNNCQYSNLNGLYLKQGARSWLGINWYHWKNDVRSLKISEMKIRPVGY